jgi:hypothetical protein
MHRRELLRAAAAAAALSLLPGEAARAWSVAAGRVSSGIARDRREVVAALADMIIPRTDTPGATDVGVMSWIDVIVSDYYSQQERDAFDAGVDAIDALSKTVAGAGFAGLDEVSRRKVMDALEAADRNNAAARGYSRIKGLVVHGYFTSEPVQREVLHTNIMPGKFEGAAAHVVKENGRNR